MSHFQNRPAIKIERLPEVLAKTGLSKSTLYSRIQKGLFIGSLSLGGRAVGWSSLETDAMVDSMLMGSSESDLKELVLQLKSRRVKHKRSATKSDYLGAK